MTRTKAKARPMIEDIPNGSGWDWHFWLKMIGIGSTAGAVLFGCVSGFMRIDARLEDHGRVLQALAQSVQAISDKATTHQVVDEKIKTACLEMAIANQGRFICPFGPAVTKRPAAKAPAKQG